MGMGRSTRSNISRTGFPDEYEYVRTSTYNKCNFGLEVVSRTLQRHIHVRRQLDSLYNSHKKGVREGVATAVVQLAMDAVGEPSEARSIYHTTIHDDDART